jgi:prepilin-type N-terminal cleavage/methylation domain-containing protein
MNEIRTNENKGFSLVELIVVIAIMAVMAAVLAPSLLGYVERSRAQKDDSAMGELTNSIKLALADQDVFDEVLAYTIKNNKACYADDADHGTLPSTPAAPYIVTKEAIAGGASDQTTSWTLDDSERKLDETKYGFAGNMRGVIVTFTATSSANKATFDLAKGKVNPTCALNGEATDVTGAKHGFFGTMKSDGSNTAIAADTKLEGKLYNRVRATVGDKIELSSQTYRNSEYSVFIRMGSTGGNQATAQDAITVYGQWNGTNLS